jgi:dUTP pyrophosphatase
MDIQVKKIDEAAILPKTMNPGDAAMDFSSLKDYQIQPGEKIIVETGIAVAIPQGYWGNIRDRSGLAAKNSIHTMAGVIDSNYRGEIRVVLINLGKEVYNIKAGDRIAQMIVEKHEDILIKEVKELDETNRGENRFGSTGQ